MEEKPAKVQRDLDRRGLLEAVRSDIARGKALQLLVDRATVVDEQGKPLDLSLPDEEPASGQQPEDQEVSQQPPAEESKA